METQERTVVKIPELIKIIKRGPNYFGVLGKPTTPLVSELRGKNVVVRLFVNGTEFAVRARVTVETSYSPPRPRIIFPRAVEPFIRKLHGMEVYAVIEYEEGGNNTKTQSG